MSTTHEQAILDQFTRQAIPFSTSPSIKDEIALNLLIQASGASPTDTVLDVACGPGLVVCAFAKVVAHATGIDITPAMLDRARQLQKEKGLTNVTWELGDVTSLPFADASFSIVTSRFAFHHILDPSTVLGEMKRVCKPGGKVVVADSSPALEKADAFNAMEKLRDPSHTRALPLPELERLFIRHGLPEPQHSWYRLESDLESLLSRSFPNPGDDDKIRALFRAALEDDFLDIKARREGDLIVYGFPVAVLVASR
jgi:ubiquinone/menaquinone biosynthesis C-methylase UbiE